MTEGERTVDGKEEDNPGLDLSIHDVKKYFAMLFNRNGPTSPGATCSRLAPLSAS